MRMLWPWALLRKVHEDERGVVSLETVLIICAIALPILAWVLLKGWPAIKAFFNTGMQQLQDDAQQVPTQN